MATKTISQLATAGNLQETDEIEVRRGAGNFKLLGSKILKTQENLNDLLDKSISRTNLDVYSKTEIINITRKSQVVFKTTSQQLTYYENEVSFICNSSNLICTLPTPDTEHNGWTWIISNEITSNNYTLSINLPIGFTFFENGLSSISLNKGECMKILLSYDDIFF